MIKFHIVLAFLQFGNRANPKSRHPEAIGGGAGLGREASSVKRSLRI